MANRAITATWMVEFVNQAGATNFVLLDELDFFCFDFAIFFIRVYSKLFANPQVKFKINKKAELLESGF